MNDLLTIVIPCKNEENYIYNLLSDLARQSIGQTRIIIADASTDNTRQVIQKTNKYLRLNIEIIEGGPVSIAKNNGAELVETPYILFIDSDVRFFSNHVIRDTLYEIIVKDYDLIGLKGKCYDGNIITQLGFVLFNVVNKIMSRWIPFAVGAYFLTRTEKFRELGGFPAKYTTSEDFILSRMYDPKKFKIANHYFGQDSRRMKKMGYFGMAKYLIKNFINRNNEEYWKSMDNSYWE